MLLANHKNLFLEQTLNRVCGLCLKSFSENPKLQKVAEEAAKVPLES